MNDPGVILNDSTNSSSWVNLYASLGVQCAAASGGYYSAIIAGANTQCYYATKLRPSTNNCDATQLFASNAMCACYSTPSSPVVPEPLATAGVQNHSGNAVMTSDSSSSALASELGSSSCSPSGVSTFACCARHLSYFSCVFNQTGYPATNFSTLQNYWNTMILRSFSMKENSYVTNLISVDSPIQ